MDPLASSSTSSFRSMESHSTHALSAPTASSSSLALESSPSVRGGVAPMEDEPAADDDLGAPGPSSMSPAGMAVSRSLCMAPESVRAYADGLGIPGLSDEACKELAEEVTLRIRNVVQDAARFAFHCRRDGLAPSDIDHALRLQGQEPLYGLSATSQHIPFRYASGGGRELHFADEKEVDLNEITTAPAPKIPLAPTLRAHWLAIDGVQPAIPENPPAQSKDQLCQESSNPLSKLGGADAKENKLAQVLLQSKPTKIKNMETVNVKQLATHELSVEQQLYYKEITEACVGSDESRRTEALQSLACDPGLHQMLPRLCTFIAEGVRVNVVQHNLAILIYLMRMVKSLLENQTLFLEKYLHELIPAVTTCIVSRQLCTRPDVDNHWALRDFASRLMNNICKNFNTSTNNIQTRVTRMFSQAMQNEKTPLVSYYGAIEGLQELGPEVIKAFVIPNIRAIATRIDQATDPNLAAANAAMVGQQQLTQANIDKLAAQHIRTLVVKSVAPVLKTVRPTPDILEEYKNDFGGLGPSLHAVMNRIRPNRQPSVPSTPSTPTATQPPRVHLAQTGGAPGTPVTPVTPGVARIVVQQQRSHPGT